MRFLQMMLLAAMLAGCSDGDSDDRRYPEICDAIVDCGAMTRDHCIEVYAPFVLTDECIQAVNQASCDDHLQSPPPYFDTCFPPCMGTGSTCQGDEITVCSQGRTKVSLCEEVCKMSGQEYIGVCADHYGEEMSPTGQDMCWCE